MQHVRARWPPQSGDNKNKPAEYAGLADKSVAIVIYVQPATINEFAGAREEISDFVTKELRVNVPTVKIINSRDVIGWENDTINWEGLSERDIGRHFSVDRVLYIEVLDYATRRTLGYSDIQGHLRAQCKVVDIESDSPTDAWSGLVDVFWPKDRPLDPTQTNEDAVRQRTLEVFSRTLIGYFYDHPEHPDDGRDQ